MLPIVTVGDALAGPTVGEVLFDNRAGVSLVLEHLHGLGHRRIAVLTPSRPSTPDRPAERVVAEVCDALGLEATVVNSPHSIEEATDTAAALLAREPRPTAVFCLSDSIACGVYAAAAAQGLEIPRDLSVAGYDGHPIASRGRPPLTTVEWGMPDVAASAAGLLAAAVAAGRAPAPGCGSRRRWSSAARLRLRRGAGARAQRAGGRRIRAIRRSSALAFRRILVGASRSRCRRTSPHARGAAARGRRAVHPRRARGLGVRGDLERVVERRQRSRPRSPAPSPPASPRTPCSSAAAGRACRSRSRCRARPPRTPSVPSEPLFPLPRSTRPSGSTPAPRYVRPAWFSKPASRAGPRRAGRARSRCCRAAAGRPRAACRGRRGRRPAAARPACRSRGRAAAARRRRRRSPRRGRRRRAAPRA